jgi:rhomboid protease GluP
MIGLYYGIIFGVIAILLILYALPEFIDFGSGAQSSRFALLQMLWKDNEYISDGDWYRLLTAIFVHGDIFHLLSNLYGFYIFATSPLFLVNPLMILIIFILGGIAGNLASYFFNPNPSLGASGGVFGLIGYTFGAFLFAGVGLFQLQFLILYIVLSFAYSFAPGSRIDFYGHLGGLIAGIGLSVLLIV